MPTTRRRVLQNSNECSRLLEELARRGTKTLRFAITSRLTTKKPTNRRTLHGFALEDLLREAFEQFYRGTELAPLLKSATAVIDVSARTIVLTKVRLRHRSRYLPKEVHDMRLR